jgi:cytoskeleton protein RodZ
MMSVGDTLRRERIRRNLQLEQISKELKISPRFLEAIEGEQFEKLPGGVFAKAFVRQYGRMLGLNEDELASQLDQVFEPPPVHESEPAQVSKAGLAPIDMPRMEEWQSVGDRRVSWSGPLSAAIMVVLVMLVCSGVYAWMQRQQHPAAVAHNKPATVPVQTQPAAAPSQAQAQQQSAPAEQHPTQPPPSTPPTSTPPATEPPAVAASPAPVQKETPAATQPAPNTDTAASTPAPAGPVHVEVTASEPVWILARADGKFAFTGTMDSNTKRTADGEKEVTLRVGNAGGVTITLNGQPIPSVGPKGQPRTIQFTSGGFHIVPAAKPPSESPAPIAPVPMARL